MRAFFGVVFGGVGGLDGCSRQKQTALPYVSQSDLGDATAIAKLVKQGKAWVALEAVPLFWSYIQIPVSSTRS